MQYTSEPQQLEIIGKNIQRIQGAAAESKGHLVIRLHDGSRVQGKLYGIHCTPNASLRIACAVDLIRNDGDYFTAVDLLEIESVRGDRSGSVASEEPLPKSTTTSANNIENRS